MKKSKKGIQTCLGPQTTVEGKLKTEGTVRIDGYFTGSIASEGCTMIVGEKAVIDADISVDSVTVSGEIRGNIHATDRIQLCPTARVFGDLHASEILIDAGAGLSCKSQCSSEPCRGGASRKRQAVQRSGGKYPWGDLPMRQRC